MRNLFVALALSLAFVATAHADLVSVEATGTVIFNAIGTPPLSGVSTGEAVTVSFLVDSADFDEGIPGDTRGYRIDVASFEMSFSGGVSVGLLDPFPAGETPYFTLVDGFPVSDGFFVSSSPISPGGVPLSQEPLFFNLDLGYVGETLTSLDILDALGTYDFDGLTRFGFNIWQVFPDNVRMEIDFAQLTIAAGPTPTVESSWGEIKRTFR